MTQEDKNILLKDLCARLPYGVKIHYHYYRKPIVKDEDRDLDFSDVESLKYNIEYVEDGWCEISWKPYLRPMSSMTEEECKELGDLPATFEGIGEVIPNVPYYIEVTRPEQIDWLNENHFDYRGLISMGLALEAPEGMYKTE